MPRLKVKHPNTGQTIEFDWANPRNPTDDEVQGIFNDHNRKAREAVHKVEADATAGLTPWEKFSSSSIGRTVSSTLERLDPIANMERLAEGVKQTVTGKGFEGGLPITRKEDNYGLDYYSEREHEKQNPPKYPRVSGLNKTVGAGMGLASVAIPGAVVRAPVQAALGFAGFEGASRGTEAVLKKAPIAPEIKDLTSTVAGLAGGYGAVKAPGMLKRPGPVAAPPKTVSTPQESHLTKPQALAEELNTPSGTTTSKPLAPEITTTKKISEGSPTEDLTLLRLHGAGTAVTANMYKQLWKSIQDGVTKIGGIEDTTLQVAKAIRAKGGLVDESQLPEIANAISSAKGKLKGRELQIELNAIVRKYSNSAESASQALAEDLNTSQATAEKPISTAPVPVSNPKDRVPNPSSDPVHNRPVELPPEVPIAPQGFQSSQMVSKGGTPITPPTPVPLGGSRISKGGTLFTPPSTVIPPPIPSAPPAPPVPTPKTPGPMMEIPTGIISRAAKTAHSWFQSSDNFLNKTPKLQPIVENIKQAFYNKYKWKQETFGELEQSTKGFKGKWSDVSDYLEGQLTNPSPEVKAVGDSWRGVLNKVHQQMLDAGVTQKSGEPVNYLKDYLTHIMKDDTFGEIISDSLKGIIGKETGIKERLFGSKKVPFEKASSGTFSKNQTPESPFVEPRTAEIPNKLLERDPRKILRAYIDSVGKVIFDKPAVLKNQKLITEIPPEAMERSSADWYNKHYAGTDEVGWMKSLRQFDRKVARMGARSVLPFNLGIQSLHGARVAVQIWPELGTKYTSIGVKNSITDFKGAYERLKASGLTQRDTPAMFKTKMELADNLGNYFDIGNSFAKMISLEGNRARLKELGDPHWERNAVYETARQEGVVNPTTPIPVATVLPKFFMQFKYWAFKYGENAATALADAKIKKDRASFEKVARYIVAGVAAEELTKKSGVKLYHLTSEVVKSSSPSEDAMIKIVRDLSNGKISEAFIEAARSSAWAGKSLVGSEGRGDNKKYKLKWPSFMLSDREMQRMNPSPAPVPSRPRRPARKR